MYISWDHVISLVVALALGGLIGLERELHHKSAGLRTNILISLGSALFTIISYELAQAEGGQPTRIASQIVGGIGFLGAGVIIHDRGGVHGITTAATIWIVAAIGVACGAGQYLLAAVATVLTSLVLMILAPVTHKIENRYSQKKHPHSPEGTSLPEEPSSSEAPSPSSDPLA